MITTVNIGTLSISAPTVDGVHCISCIWKHSCTRAAQQGRMCLWRDSPPRERTMTCTGASTPTDPASSRGLRDARRAITYWSPESWGDNGTRELHRDFFWTQEALSFIIRFKSCISIYHSSFNRRFYGPIIFYKHFKLNVDAETIHIVKIVYEFSKTLIVRKIFSNDFFFLIFSIVRWM